MFTLPTLAELEAASQIVYEAMPPTLQHCWPLLSARAGCEVWVKHENQTPVGAFKVRGGLVFLEHLRRTNPQATGIISATRGNHGQSLGFAARKYGFHAVIVVPHGNSPEKNASMRALGVELVEYGRDFQEANEHASQLAGVRRLYRVPSFAPPLVEGVGTLSLEFLRAVPDLDILYVSIGLGSAVCGAIAAREALGLTTRIVGVVSAKAPAYALSFAQRKPVSHESATMIADGMAVRVPDEDALDVICKYADRIVEVSDSEIEEAMRAIYSDTHNVAEGAGAAGAAALLKEKDKIAGKKAGIILSGANVDRAVFARVLAG